MNASQAYFAATTTLRLLLFAVDRPETTLLFFDNMGLCLSFFCRWNGIEIRNRFLFMPSLPGSLNHSR